MSDQILDPQFPPDWPEWTFGDSPPVTVVSVVQCTPHSLRVEVAHPGGGRGEGGREGGRREGGREGGREEEKEQECRESLEERGRREREVRKGERERGMRDNEH